MNGGTTEEIFKAFYQAESFKTANSTFNELCKKANLDRSHVDFLNRAKEALPLKEVQDLWKLLDKRRSHADFMKGKACKDAKVLIIGGGPCGLRMAIDTALLGAKVVLLEKRDYISRNNVLHIWPFVIHDLKSIGTKIFYPQFCVGSMDHISIRRLQLVLVKICLLVGVEIVAPVGFEGLIKPTSPDEGWRAKVSPPDHPVGDFEFDTVIGADGKRNCLGFERKCFRAKQALAIAVNFVNRRTKEENAIEEIGGINFVMRRDFFNNMKNSTGIDLENFVYYKNDTHYFVMTAKKKSLLQKAVLKQDFSSSAELLHPTNIDNEKLSEFAYKAADVSVNGEIPNLELVVNHRGEDDVSIFDFTAMFQANYSCKAMEEQGKRLLMSIIGDTLIEPFWPTGTGAARGFLSALDATWLLRQWCRGDMDPLEAIAEREQVYQLLSQTTPNSMSKKMNAYSINPMSRYGTKGKVDKMKIGNVRHLFNHEGESPLNTPASKLDLVKNIPLSKPITPIASTTPVQKRLGNIIRQASVAADGHRNLLGWYQNKLLPYNDRVQVKDLTESWRNGVALSVIFHMYRPKLLAIDNLVPDNIEENNQQVFKLIEEEFGVSPRISPFDLASDSPIETLGMLSYLTQLHDCLVEELPVKVPRKEDEDISPEEEAEIKRHRFKSHGRRRSSAAILKRMHSRDNHHATIKHTRPQRKQPESAYERAQREVQAMRERRAEKEKKMKMQNDRGAPTYQSNASIKLQPHTLEDKNQRKSVQDIQTFYKNNDKSFKHSDLCCICEKRLYVVERRTAHGYFFHRNCLHCSECKVILRLDSSRAHEDENGKVRFTCLKKACTSAHLQKADEMSSTDEETKEPLEDTLTELKTMLHYPDSSGTDESSSGNSETDSDSDQGVPEEDKMIYKLSRKHSVCLLLADEIQEQFETVQDEENKLEVRGLEAEKQIRNEEQHTDDNVDQEQAMENFLEIITMQQQLENWQSEIMLKIKLMELGDEKSKLESTPKPLPSIKAKESEKSDVKDNVKSLAAQIKSLKSFLDDAEGRLDKLQD